LVESFDGRTRNEVLDETLSSPSAKHAQSSPACDTERPRSSLAYASPAAFAAEPD